MLYLFAFLFHIGRVVRRVSNTFEEIPRKAVAVRFCVRIRALKGTSVLYVGKNTAPRFCILFLDFFAIAGYHLVGMCV